MYKARQYLNKSSLVNLYYSYVYPYLTYCIKIGDVLIQLITNVCSYCKKKSFVSIHFLLSCSHRAIIYVSRSLAIRKDILS